MHTSTFTYIPIKVGEPMLVTIDRDDEFNHVTIGDTYLGVMVQNDDAPYGWQTEDALLLEELPDLSMALKEQKAIYNLPYALKEQYGENLVGWDWDDNEEDVLKLIAHQDTDLVDFAGVLRDQVNEVVLFEKAVIIYLSKEGSDEVEEIHINS